MKWHKPEFYTEPGPSGPEGIKTQSRILRAGTFVEGCRGIPRKRGSGGGATMGGDAHRSPPPAAFWFLFRRGKRNSPKGRKPVRRRAESSRPTDVMVYGGRADLHRPYNISGKMQKKRTAGRRPQRKAQRSGFALERRSDGMSKLCPSGRSEGYGIRDAEGPPLQRLRRITAERENGRGKPLPYGTVGKHSALEDAQKTQHPAGLLKKGHGGA